MVVQFTAIFGHEAMSEVVVGDILLDRNIVRAMNHDTALVRVEDTVLRHN